MYEELDVTAYREQPPSLIYALSEIPRTMLEIASLAVSFPLLGSLKHGDGHPVLVLPGFMAGDESTSVLRRYLRVMGYHSVPWKLGRNTGKLELMQHQLVDRFLEVFEASEQKISIIGQSLGGVFGRELARRYPDQVRQVITLGSPFATRRTGSTLPIVQDMFERSAGMSIETMRELLISIDSDYSPPVPLTAIYSKGDGIVNWRVCCEAHEDVQTQNIEVIGSHCGMAFNPVIYYLIANRLAQAEDEWQRFNSDLPGCSLKLYAGS